MPMDIGSTFGLFSDYANKVSALCVENKTDFASMIASFRNGVEKTISKLNEAMTN